MALLIRLASTLVARSPDIPFMSARIVSQEESNLCPDGKFVCYQGHMVLNSSISTASSSEYSGRARVNALRHAV